jgi:hypothetical protein
MIYDIIGEDSPVLDGLRIPESGRRQPPAAPEQEVEFDEEGEPISTPPLRRQKKRRVAQSELLDVKRQKQVELLELQAYKTRLDCLKLERDLQLEPSDYTKSLIRLVAVFEPGEVDE